jgi:outer membrane protein assembly factor BamB
VDVDDDQMYVSASDGSLVALKRRTGIEVWRNETLKRRSLSAPVVVGDHVAVADLEGYVHFFDRATGAIAARAKTSGDRVTNAPLSVGGMLYVISDKGDIAALHGLPIEARAARTAPAADPAGGTNTPASPPPGG